MILQLTLSWHKPESATMVTIGREAREKKPTDSVINRIHIDELATKLIAQ